MSCEQDGPRKPAAHVHLYVSSSDVHVAPFLHGCDAQWSCSSQWLPVKPAAHVQVYLSSDLSEQVPPFKHGSESHELAMGISHSDAE